MDDVDDVDESDLAADDRPVTLATIDDEVDDVHEVDASAVSARLPARRSMMPGRVYPFLESKTRRARLQLTLGDDHHHEE